MEEEMSTKKRLINKMDDQEVFQRLFDNDDEREIEKKGYRKAVIVTLAITMTLLIAVTTIFMFSVNYIRDTYVSHEKDMILAMSMVESANDWESMPEGQQREKLLNRYMEIIKYYNVYTPDNEKMSHETIIESFNVLYDCTKMTRVNIFLPIAYMKVMTNFNPSYDADNRYGISAFFVKEGENISNLPIVTDKVSFDVSYKGIPTLQNPIESIKLLVAKIDDLNKIFNNRSDWVIFALLTNEYEVIDKYWLNGEGIIPDEQLLSGKLKEVREFYYILKNWKIVPADGVKFPIVEEEVIEEPDEEPYN